MGVQNGKNRPCETNFDFQSRQMEMKTSQGFCLLASELMETKHMESLY